MARTRKSVSALNLYKYDVLIEDQGPRSDYFKISQFDGYFYGGRNAFLVAGAATLRPNSKILVEILNKDGNTVYGVPVPKFIEGNSRLVQVEVYKDTPIGPGKIVLLGCTDYYKDGTPVPPEWRGKFNVRWTADVIISPRVENKTPIRFIKPPEMVVNEKFYLEPSSSVYVQSIQVPLDIEFEPKYLNIFPNGYLLKAIGPTTNSKFTSDYLNGKITGSLLYITANGTESVNVQLPITKIFNSNLAETDGTLLYTDNKTLILQGLFSSSNVYTTNITPLGDVFVTGALSLEYDKLETFDTIYDVSYAKIRIVNLGTISGEIHKIRLSYKPTAEPGEYVLLGDINTEVQELFTIDSSSKIFETGKFTDALVTDDYWYSTTMSLQKNDINPQVPTYYNSSSIVVNSFNKSPVDLLNAIGATPPIVGNAYINNVSYFIGNRGSNEITLFPQSEYTIKFDAIVNKYSGSVELIQPDYSMEVYLVPSEVSGSTVLAQDLRGQLLGVLTPLSTFTKQNFENTQFNFVPNIKTSGTFGIRFVIYGGQWSIANVSVKTAEEPLFSPDEVDILLQNTNYKNKVLTFKADYLDINNNSIGISTFSTPTFFAGSQTTPFDSSSVASSSYALTASYALGGIGANIFPYTGSAIFSGSLRVTGSITNTRGGFTGSLFGTSSRAISSSYAVTSSYALSANVFPYTGSAIFSGSVITTGSMRIVSGGFTGSLFGTASRAVTSSYAITASYAQITNLPPSDELATVFYVTQEGSDSNNGKTLGTAFRTIKQACQAASNYINSVVGPPLPRVTIQVSTGYYSEVAPITVPRNTSIMGNDLRTVVISPTVGTKGENLFLMNNATYAWGLRLEGCEIDDLTDPRKGFFFAFAPSASIVTSPYIQNCTANHAPAAKFYVPLDYTTQNPEVGNGPGGMIVDDSVLDGYSPLRSMIVDAYTQVAFNGIGICVRGAGYAQLVSFFTNFSHVGVWCIDGGHASLLNSNTTFGDYGLRASGKRILVVPDITAVSTASDSSAASLITSEKAAIQNYMMTKLQLSGSYSASYLNPSSSVYAATIKDSGILVDSISSDLLGKKPGRTAQFTQRLFKGQDVSSGSIYTLPPATGFDTGAIAVFRVNDGFNLANDFIKSWQYIKEYIVNDPDAKFGSLSVDIKQKVEDIVDMPINTITSAVINNEATLLQEFGSLATSTSHDFSYAGAGVNFLALPTNQSGIGETNLEIRVYQENGGRVYHTSGDETGDFYTGQDFVIRQATGTIEGRTFNKATAALFTPLILALES